MPTTNFAYIADKTLRFVSDTIETKDTDGLIDIDFNGDVLSISTSHGIFVVNKHSITQQIWLSSPISGPYRFSYIDNNWVNDNESNLLEILARELQIPLCNVIL